MMYFFYKTWFLTSISRSPMSYKGKKDKMETAQPRIPTVRESLAKIAKHLEWVEFKLNDLNGDPVLIAISHALYDIAEFGPGKMPKGYYDWKKS